MSNPSMPGIMKIGMTMRTPEERLKEANKHDTFKPPTLYQIDFAKEVLNPKTKEVQEIKSPQMEKSNEPDRLVTHVRLLLFSFIGLMV